jgi:hypothetical protein
LDLVASVDVGTMRSVDADEIEVLLRWPSRWVMPASPSTPVPEGTEMLARERVRCTSRGPAYFEIESWIVAPDGHEVSRTRRDLDEARKRPPPGSSYGRDPRSFVCWALARTCAHEPITWPPPPNLAPLDGSEAAEAMRAAHSARFVPSCKLPARAP